MTTQRRPRPYRSTKALLWLVPAIVVEVFLYSTYGEHDAATHWLTHFLVGGSVALALLAAWTWRSRRLPSKPLIWILVGHLYAMVPDVIFNNFNQPHEWWMEVFLFHISSHFIPGRNWTWVAVFSLALSAYLYVVDRRVVAEEC